MKLAVIDHILNPGGGSRFVSSLLLAMKKIRPDLQITFFVNAHGMRRDRLAESLEAQGIRMSYLKSVQFSGRDFFGLKGSRHALRMFQSKLAKLDSFFPVSLSGAVHRELEKKVRGFDFALFTWPFHLQCPQLDCPMAGVFHDFNYKYYFSGHAMPLWHEAFLNTHMPTWLARTTPIVSTDFMKSEVQKFYPDFGDKTKVVPIAPMNYGSSQDITGASAIVAQLGIPKDYLLCPTHAVAHKNAGPLLSAQALLRKRGHPTALIFVGSGTELMQGKSCSIGLERGEMPQDVYGLGYVTNAQIDALIQCARIVVNPSLYEGGNGPGFEAWAKGIPVAMSHIPPFLEHLRVHDVRAAIFDPRSPEDIAEKLEQILLNPEKAAIDAAHSKNAMGRFTWDLAAKAYLDIVEEALMRSIG